MEEQQRRRRGRPVGAKNKPKVELAQDFSTGQRPCANRRSVLKVTPIDEPVDSKNEPYLHLTYRLERDKYQDIVKQAVVDKPVLNGLNYEVKVPSGLSTRQIIMIVCTLGIRHDRYFYYDDGSWSFFTEDEDKGDLGFTGDVEEYFKREFPDIEFTITPYITFRWLRR